MTPKPRSSTSATLWTILPPIAVFLFFLVAYQSEVSLVWQSIVARFKVFIMHVNVEIPTNAETARASAVLEWNLIILLFGYLFVLLWVSQFTLPVRGWRERWMAFKRLLLYTVSKNSHGPAVFMKEGKPKAEEGELNDTKKGVVFVDLNSAIVLEQQLDKWQADSSDALPEKSAETKLAKPIFWSPLKLFISKAKPPISKACGPGLVFTKSGEKIIGWVDLRKQSRTREDVVSSTRDGIEVKTKITVGFTLGQKEDVLKVAKINGDWVTLQSEYVINLGNVFKPGEDELDELDKKELDPILSQWENGQIKGDIQIGEIKSGVSSQFHFDAKRVFSAVYSRARDVKEETLGNWTDLPVLAATEVFRNLLAHENYDDLYLPANIDKYPLADFKAKFGRDVRNMGMLSYQMVKKKDGYSLEDGQTWHEDELDFSVPMQFNRPAVLRDRGIKVLFASFSELIPTDGAVRAQLLENWRAHWQQETQKTLADHELRAIRVHNHERARTQQDMIYSLSRIFRDGHYSDEALAIRLYQSLEVAATNPATQRLLPGDTVQMLSNLRHWLLPPDDDNRDKGKGISSDEVAPIDNAQ